MRTGELYQRYNGLYLGTVVNVEDPEGLGRIRVQMDQFEDSDDEPVYASVARPLAGSGGSVFFTPKEGDQVVVGFMVGDVNEPIILGYAHSDKKRPPSEVSAPSKHGIAVQETSIVFDENAGDIVVNEGDQKVARVNDSIDAGTLVFVVKAGVLTLAKYFAAGITGTFEAGVFATSQTIPPDQTAFGVALDAGLITSGAAHLKA